MRVSRFVGLVVLVVVLLALTQELSAQNKDQRTKYFCGIGRVVSIDEDKSGVTIKHEAIEGYMPAMTMHFKALDKEVLNDVAAGNTVRFTLKDTPELTRLIYIEKIAPETRRKGKRAERTSSQASSKTRIDFELQDLSGKPVKLSDYRGKVVLVNFWASWCGPCEFEIPVFLRMRRQLQKRGFEVIGISMDEGSLEQLTEFIKQLKINYPVVLGASANLEMFGAINGLPTSFLIDREGRIHSRHQGLAGLNEIENEVAKVLAAK